MAAASRDPIEVRGIVVGDGPPGLTWYSNVDQKGEDEVKSALSWRGYERASVVAFALMLLRWFMEPASHGGILVSNDELRLRHYGTKTKRKGRYVRTMLTILISVGFITSEGRGTSRMLRPAGLSRKILDRLLVRVETHKEARRRRKREDALAKQRRATAQQRRDALAEARELGKESRAKHRAKLKHPPG
ncbi:hypothetical protein F4Y93_12250 [Candidatus Poribacteria bacterium]|nr:hypothetical protein [Candidatus Poribacteria bacterium]